MSINKYIQIVQERHNILIKNVSLHILQYFLYQGFLSHTLTIHKAVGKKGTVLIPHVYQFHPLTKIETLISQL